MRGHGNGGLLQQLLVAAHQDPQRAVALGTLLAVLAAIANGSFAVLAKSRLVRSARVEPYIFNFWACVGIFISSLLVLVKVKFVWTWWAFLSALFFVLSLANAFRAVRAIGVSIGTGIWAGTAVLVSFLAGVILDPHGRVGHVVMALFAIAIIIGGIAGVTWSGHVGRSRAGEEERLETLLGSERGVGLLENEGDFAAGVISAVIAGFLGGLIMLPMTRAPPQAQGMHYVVPFGIFVMMVAPVVTALPNIITSTREWPNFHWGVAVVPGIVSGVVWNIGNMLSIAAITYLGYSVAYPIFQCGIFVAGLWGMFLFEEIRNDAATKFWGSGLVIAVGIVLLSYAAI